jgi:hypothetical protein
MTLVASLTATQASAQENGPSWQANGLSPSDHITVAKSPSGRLAQTDPALLGRTDSTTMSVLVKLDYDATASYAGGVDGLAATSPKVTGRKLNGNSPAERAYGAYTAGIEQRVVNALHQPTRSGRSSPSRVSRPSSRT